MFKIFDFHATLFFNLNLVKSWRKALGGALNPESEKEILRICVTEDAEALKRYLKTQFDEGRQNLYNFISNIFN